MHFELNPCRTLVLDKMKYKYPVRHVINSGQTVRRLNNTGLKSKHTLHTKEHRVSVFVELQLTNKISILWRLSNVLLLPPHKWSFNAQFYIKNVLQEQVITCFLFVHTRLSFYASACCQKCILTTLFSGIAYFSLRMAT